MPTYAYRCSKCGHHADIFQKITENPLTKCPACQKDGLQRGPGGGIGVSFAGGGAGFYSNDYSPSAPKSQDAPASSSACCPCGKNKCS